MKCSEVSGLLSQYLDSEMDELRRQGVKRHLEKCAGCSRELATLSKAVRVMRAVAELDPLRTTGLPCFPPVARKPLTRMPGPGKRSENNGRY
ncbi:MAG: anti-sigma factor family protein [Bacillota bacterium]